jgi:molybdate transport system permease protein
MPHGEPAGDTEPRRGFRGPASDTVFLTALSALGGCYLLLIVAMLAADASFTSPPQLLAALQSPQIRYAVWLSLISCSVTAVLSLVVAVPLGYLLSRFRFPFKWLVDALLDIPIVLPPLVIGLSLLILFQTRLGRGVEQVWRRVMDAGITYAFLPVSAVLTALLLFAALKLVVRIRLPFVTQASLVFFLSTLVFVGFLASSRRESVQEFLRANVAAGITYEVPSVILAQFAVAAAFAVRTMRVAFDDIPPRREQVALTLGCGRAQAFWRVVLPEARRGMVTATTLAWARALGEFGPILVFSGATRMKTEVLSTTVFLELSVGNLRAAVAVSLLMVLAALVVLVIVRRYGMGRTSA